MQFDELRLDAGVMFFFRPLYMDEAVRLGRYLSIVLEAPNHLHQSGTNHIF